jgi:hypothetical protein
VNALSTIARTISWGLFLIVSLMTGGNSLAPEGERHLVGMLQTDLLLSGVSLIAAVEFHLQRFELARSKSAPSLPLALACLILTYYVVAGVAAHSGIATTWGLLLSWLFGAVGWFYFIPGAHFVRRLVIDCGVLIVVGGVLYLTLGIVLWNKFYYGFLAPERHLGWTPYFMSAIGLIVWAALFTLNRRLKLSAQQFATSQPQTVTD